MCELTYPLDVYSWNCNLQERFRETEFYFPNILAVVYFAKILANSFFAFLTTYFPILKRIDLVISVARNAVRGMFELTLILPKRTVSLHLNPNSVLRRIKAFEKDIQ